MAIIISASAVVPSRNLQKMLYDKVIVAALARQIVANQVEAHIDMARDFGTEYSKFEEVDGCIQGAKETVEDFVADLLTDFRDMLYAEIRDVKIVTKKVSFEQDGLDDAEVEVL